MENLFRKVLQASLGGGLPVVLAVAALTAGVLALVLMPREEEPQIVVPNADVIIHAPSLNARQVERLVSTPLEKLLAQIDGVEHVYSVSGSGQAVVSVNFYVGEDREDSLLKLFSKLYSNEDVVPSAVASWVVRPVAVDDVPIVTATLWSDHADAHGTYELRRIAEEVAIDLQAIRSTNRIEVIGGPGREFRVLLHPVAMIGRSTSFDDILMAFRRSNLRILAGEVDALNNRVAIEVDARIASVTDLERLVVNVVDGSAVHLEEVAAIIDGPAEAGNYTWVRFSPQHSRASSMQVADPYPAVNIAVAKQKGSNAVAVADAVVDRLNVLAATLFPEGVHVEVTRNYGATADQKMSDLLGSLAVAIIVVVLLIGVILGWRAALVVALTVPVCYGVTLMLGYAAGYTVNRVTLFALILALGLLVDDPITGVDNMQRHLLGKRSGTRAGAIVQAILEIRLPLLMSTVAIVIVFAPMSFITGMMGPYMSPMAFNVPVAVIVSTLVAFLVTPWLGIKLLKPAVSASATSDSRGWYAYLLTPLLERRLYAVAFLVLLMLLLVLALLLPLARVIPLKLLPYDNKNEFQLVIDAPEGTTLESSDGIARQFAEHLSGIPEVLLVNAFIGTHAPMDFNGLIRRYYQRRQSHQGELHVVLAPKKARPDQSHELVLRLRPGIEVLAERLGVSAKIVEVPPGPPVVATIVAEHYGSTTTSYGALNRAARKTAERLAREEGVVDVDVSAQAPHMRWVFQPDQEKAALSGVGADVIGVASEVLARGGIAGYAAVPDEANPLPIRLRVPYAQRGQLDHLFVKGMPGVAKLRQRDAVVDAPTALVSLMELGSLSEMPAEELIFHKDLRPVAYTYAEVAGRMPAAVIFDLEADLNLKPEEAGGSPRPAAERSYFSPGAGISWSQNADISVQWSGEGEWNITLRVFRDLGIAFGVALLGLFVVIRLQTGLSALTGIIMLSIPLTAIGVMPGFWLMNLFGADLIGEYANPTLFTATAMIGMIALAGIVVRNSLILVEFVQQACKQGMPLNDALVEAGRLRARPVLLTAGTTLLGNVVITLDPIFAGLAWTIIYGVTASTLFTLFVVPVVYRLVYGEKHV